MGAVFTSDNRLNWDADLFRFWPLQEVWAIRDDRAYDDLNVVDRNSYFIFADHSILLPAYAIRLDTNRRGDHPVIAFSWDGYKKRHDVSNVAHSFSEFVEKYLKDQNSRIDLAYR
jgi:hypothetical protein